MTVYTLTTSTQEDMFNKISQTAEVKVFSGFGFVEYESVAVRRCRPYGGAVVSADMLHRMLRMLSKNSMVPISWATGEAETQRVRLQRLM